jgi:cytoskeletal protein CcmA (bactofilin family)
MATMWKANSNPSPSPSPTPEPMRLIPSAKTVQFEARAAGAPEGHANIGKKIVLMGDITSPVTHHLIIDGHVQGNITLPGSRVTVGSGGRVNGAITAREVVIGGTVVGNVMASDRVEIRTDGILTGDLSAARISIGEDATFKGRVDIRKSGYGSDSKSASAVSTRAEALRMAL